MSDQPAPLEPAEFSAYALRALEAAEGRRKRRKRDTTLDVVGLHIKRDLLQRAVEQQPAAAEFEAWLLRQVQWRLPAVPFGPCVPRYLPNTVSPPVLRARTWRPAGRTDGAKPAGRTWRWY